MHRIIISALAVTLLTGCSGDDSKPDASEGKADGKKKAPVSRFVLRDSVDAKERFTVSFGVAKDKNAVGIAGDWDGDGKDTVGLFYNGRVRLTNSPKGEGKPIEFKLGNAGDIPVVGDWDGDGKDSVGVYRKAGGTFYLYNKLSEGKPDARVSMGGEKHLPVAGDWDGDGKDTVGTYIEGVFYLSVPGKPAMRVKMGNANFLPLAGDWDGDGKDGVGIIKDGRYRVRNALNDDAKADVAGAIGQNSDAVVGDWNGDDSDGIGLYVAV